MVWDSENGISYAYQSRPDLVNGVWSNELTGLTGPGVIAVTNDTTDPVKFYRVIVE